MPDITWDEFERRLIVAGWTPEDAKREREAQEHGDLGDCDGDLEIENKMVAPPTTQPLPDEIAGLIKWLEGSAEYLERTFEAVDPPPRKVAAALRALAQENARLKAEEKSDADTIKAHAACIRELEAENDTLRESVNAVRAEYLRYYLDATARAEKAEAERDALQAPRR